MRGISMKLFAYVSLLLVLIQAPVHPVAQAAEDCENSPDPAQALAQSLVDANYEPAQWVGSCAQTAHDRPENWRDSLGKDIDQFLADDHQKMIKEVNRKELNHSLDLFLSGAAEAKGFAVKSEVKNSPAYYANMKGSLRFARGDANIIKNVSRSVDAYGKPRVDAATAAWADTESSAFSQKLAQDQNLKQRIKASAEAKACVSGVDFSLEPTPGLFTERLVQLKPDQSGMTSLTTEEARAQLKAKLSALEAKSGPGEMVYSCTEPYTMFSDLAPAPIEITVDVASETVFDDNVASLNERDLTAFNQSLEKQLSDARKKHPGCDLKVSSIDAHGSASTLRNTGNYPPFEFRKLSSDRASYLANKTEEYLAKNKIEKAPGLHPVIDGRGSNGDGTSNQCMYQVSSSRKANGKYVISQINLPKAELAKARYGKVSIQVEQSGPQCKSSAAEVTANQAYLGAKCYQVRVSCKSSAQARN